MLTVSRSYGGDLTHDASLQRSKGGSLWIAERWEQNGDATQFTLHVKKGVTFSDGNRLEAALSPISTSDMPVEKNHGINPIGLFPETHDRPETIEAATVSADARGFVRLRGSARNSRC